MNCLANVDRPATSVPAMRQLPLLLFVSCAGGSVVVSEHRLTGAGPEHVFVRIPAGPGVPRAFWLGKYEVTQAQFAAFVQATGYDGREAPSSKPTEPFLADWRDAKPPPGQEDHPACQLNWHHARAFCAWLSQRSGCTVRLPRDVEWQWAARGAAGRVYPWGDAWQPTYCNWGDGGTVDGFTASAPVGAFAAGATPEGVFDLAGNIWEWSADGHLLGGPWCMGAEVVRADGVAHEDPMRADDKFGLRLVVELP